MDPNRLDSLGRTLGIPSRRRVSRALLGVGLGGGLRSLAGGRDAAAKKGKKGKKCKKTPRCLSGKIFLKKVCATRCEVNEDCGGPPVFCHDLADHSARVCIISDAVDPEEMPPCPSRRAADCSAGRVCYDFAQVPVCGRPM